MIPWKTVAQDVEEKTKNYWRVSLIWNSRSTEEMVTGDAIVLCVDNLKYTNPARPIVKLSTRLLDELVKGEGSPHPDQSQIYAFPEVIDAMNALDHM